MIYLNNSATSYPKPESVIEEISRSLKLLPGAQFRASGAEECLTAGGVNCSGSSRRGFVDNNEVFDVCRGNIGRLLNIRDTERIYFTSGSTEALNLLMQGIAKGLAIRTDEILITQTEHNSVLRVVYNMTGSERGTGACGVCVGEPQIVKCDRYGFVDAGEFEECLKNAGRENLPDESCVSGDIGAPRHSIKLCVVNHCSNVTGAVQDIKRLCEIAHRYGAIFIADISQSAGAIPVDIDGWDIDAAAFTGHKSLLGPQGTGGYYVKRSVALVPLMYGGTGRDSRVIKYRGYSECSENTSQECVIKCGGSNDADSCDYEYEVGTMNACGIHGLNAGVSEVLGRGVSSIEDYERELTEYAADGLKSIKGVTVYRDFRADASEKSSHINNNKSHSGGLSGYGPVVSFDVDGLTPADTAYILQNVYGIVTRAGLHCAPLIHDALGVKNGTVRVSPGIYNTRDDIDALVKAVGDIAGESTP